MKAVLLLNRIGYSHKRVTLLYSVMAVCQCAAAVWMVKSLGAERAYVFVPFMIGYWFCARAVISAARRDGIVL